MDALPAEVPVLIVGAGPVGLTLAIGLRRFGVECVVVERHPSTSIFPKGRGLSTRSMEIFRAWDLEEEILAAGLPRELSLFTYVAETLLAGEHQRFGRADRTGNRFSPTNRLICSQDLLEPILRRRAEALGAVVRFGAELVDLETGPGDVLSATVVGRDDGEEARVRADYVIGADGARSTVRSWLGVGFEGPGEVDVPKLSILVDADLRSRVADRASGLYWVERPAPKSVFAVVDNDRRWLLITDHAGGEPPPPATCVAMVRAGVGDDSVEVSLVGSQLGQPTARVASSFRVGRAFLAGDAAHVTTPAGGLGMNCGIADAHNLAWKLAAVLQDRAADTLLDSYEPERRPIAQWSMETSVALLTAPEGPRRLVQDGITLGYAYDSSAVVADGTEAPSVDDAIRDYVPVARPGHRLPHVEIDDGNGGPTRSSHDLLGDHFTLLAGPDATGVRDVHSEVHQKVIDDGKTLEAFGIFPDGALLVRPDGHVGWRSPRQWSPRQLAAALASITGLPDP